MCRDITTVFSHRLAEKRNAERSRKDDADLNIWFGEVGVRSTSVIDLASRVCWHRGIVRQRSSDDGSLLALWHFSVQSAVLLFCWLKRCYGALSFVRSLRNTFDRQSTSSMLWRGAELFQSSSRGHHEEVYGPGFSTRLGHPDCRVCALVVCSENR